MNETLTYLPDIFAPSQGNAPLYEPLAPPNFQAFPLPRKHPLFGKVVRWQFTMDDLRGGFAERGDYPHIYNRTSASTLLNNFYRTLCLPPLQTNATDGLTTTAASTRIAAAYALSKVVMGIGSAANHALFSGSTGALTAHTYDPGGIINALHPIIIGGATSAERLAVCRANATIEVLSALGTTPTSDGTMHANLTKCDGLITSYLNASNPSTGTHLIKANNNIYTLAITEALGAAPVVAGTAGVVPNGGWAMGTASPDGYPDRAWWAWATADGATTYEVVSTNLEGTDPQRLTLPFRFIDTGFLWKNGLFLTDGQGKTAYEFNGSRSRDLRWRQDRPLDATYSGHRIRGGWPAGDDLYVLWSAVTTGVADADVSGVDFYSSALQQWFVGVPQSTAVVTPLRAAGQLPFEPVSRIMHWYSNTQASTNDLRRIYMPVPGENFYNQRGNTGAASSAASGVWTSPIITLPGLGQYPSVISETDQTQCDIDSGGSGATQKVEIAQQSAGTSLAFSSNLSSQFSTADPIAKRVRRFGLNRDAFNQLQIRQTLTRSATTTNNLNGLPLTIRGLTFLDGRVRDPVSVLGKDWLHG